jgi:hypothetical protein
MTKRLRRTPPLRALLGAIVSLAFTLILYAAR